MPIEPIIQSTGLTRDFKETRAVDAIDLAIQPGELFGLVGPDGAGKTTVLRLLAGLLDITAGSAHVAGFDLNDRPEDVKPNIGYMAQDFSLYADLTVLENLAFFADIYEVPPGDQKTRADRLLAFAALTDFKDRRASHLSGGMQKKLSLACTLIHQPKILLLDEPTTGVDPVSRREFWNILTELHLAGTTIVVSTPYMDEADRCSRVALMYQGRIVVCDTPKRIRSQIEGEIVELRADDWQKAHGVVELIPGVLEVQNYGELLHVLVDSAELRTPAIEKALHAQGIRLQGTRSAPARMEEAFISLIRRMET